MNKLTGAAITEAPAKSVTPVVGHYHCAIIVPSLSKSSKVVKVATAVRKGTCTTNKAAKMPAKCRVGSIFRYTKIGNEDSRAHNVRTRGSRL